MKSKYHIKQWTTVVLASLLYAVAFELFLIPNKVVAGGVTGISAIIDIFLGQEGLFFTAGVWSIIINIPIIIYVYVNHNQKFATKTLAFVLLTGVFMLLLRILNIAEWLRDVMSGSESDKIMFTLIGGAISGLGLPLMLSVNGSTGGSDIVGLILQKRAKSSSSDGLRAVFFANIIILLIASIIMGIVQDVEQAINLFVYSTASMIVGRIVHERLFRGFSSAIELEITTDQPHLISKALMEKLGHGCTFLNVKGGYSNANKTMLLCVINRRQLTLARKVIREVDPNCFAYAENVREVMGKGFVNKEDNLESE